MPFSRNLAADIANAGGAYVRRRMTMGSEERLPGDTLTADELSSIPEANLRALINTGRLELWPKPPEAKAPRRTQTAA